jgi:hypothetical protein
MLLWFNLIVVVEALPTVESLPQNADLLFSCVAYAFHGLGSFQVPRTNSSPGSVSGGHVSVPNGAMLGLRYDITRPD